MAPPSVRAHGVTKGFRLPHQRYSTLKERALHPFTTRTHDELHALDDVSFEVANGEFFGIVGRNGSGKSTLLKCLAGIYGIDSGEIAVAGRVSPFIELGVGFNPELTARDNVLINAIMLGLTRTEAKQRFDTIIDFAELNEFVDLPLKNYSSGMAVRLGFAVAVEVDAEILLVDEVLAVGDASFQQKCFEEFGSMRSEGRTILFVTHDMSSVERFCDRAMLVERGVVNAIGDPEEIAQRYNEVNFGVTPGVGTAGDGESQARVRGAWCEDAAGQRILSSTQGERCVACIEMEVLQPLERAAFSVTFRNEARHTVYVATSGPEAIAGPFEVGQRLVVRLAFENWLAPNRYTLTPTVAESGPPSRGVAATIGLPATIDEQPDMAALVVEGPSWTGGVADLPTELDIQRT
jgi:ABC-type polysaccharide/polyol phosphate transport system ATPase subunit